MIIDTLKEIFEEDKTRGIVIVISLAVMISLLVWVSIIDIKKKSITFWKMLIASSSTIIMPFIESFFCGCPILKWFLLGSLFLWFGLLYLNIRFNKDKFIGKADIDLLSAIFAECVGFSVWLYFVIDHNFVWMRITHVWYSLFLYLLLGSLIYLAVFLLFFLIRFLIFKKRGVKKLIKTTKISVIPMFMPVSIMIPFLIMTI